MQMENGMTLVLILLFALTGESPHQPFLFPFWTHLFNREKLIKI